MGPPQQHGARAAARPETPEHPPLLWTSLVALGIVYGDIGTSPLYAFRESLLGGGARLLPTDTNVLGILSLIFWALIVVISIKYLLLVMRADNHGEGGIVALVSLLNPRQAKPGTLNHALVVHGTVRRRAAVWRRHDHAGDLGAQRDRGPRPRRAGVRAVRGPDHDRHPARCCSAFSIAGTAAIGSVFGPIMLIWFLALAALGVGGILRAPEVLEALNPLHGYRFFATAGDNRVRGAWLGLSRGHRRRGSVRRLGPLRPGADPADLVRGRPAGAGAELLRSGRAGVERSGRRSRNPSTSWSRLGPLPAGAARDRSHGDRLAGADLRRILADRPDRPAAAAAAPQHRPHVTARRRGRFTSRASTGS